mgnify:FL=1
MEVLFYETSFCSAMDLGGTFRSFDRSAAGSAIFRFSAQGIGKLEEPSERRADYGTGSREFSAAGVQHTTYVVFNISLSINLDSTNHKGLMVQDGYACAKSWLRTCADKGVWTMIQPSSGGQSHFPDYNASTDYEDTIFAEFFRDYPNFIGYNYCEQF